ELVIVIAILAILAAIAIPVVNSIINTASKNGALSNAETIELAIKECQADIAAKNTEVYNGTTIFEGSEVIPNAATKHGEIQVKHVAKVKAINDAFKTVTYNGADYDPYWDKTDDKCFFMTGTDAASYKTLDGSAVPSSFQKLAAAGAITDSVAVDNL
ncbi:MAG: hypothetical protein UE295_09450, partial [Acutalibacteraceae bacterium]|nr:hypothetical protein [Acutalibacteraceae bacterium]